MKATLVALLTIALVVTGCSTTRLYTPGGAARDASALMHAGDRATILLKSGETRVLKISALDEHTLTGLEGRGSKAVSVQIALADVQSIEVRRGSILRTAGLTLGVIVGIAAVAVGGLLVAQCGVKLDNCGD